MRYTNWLITFMLLGAWCLSSCAGDKNGDPATGEPLVFDLEEAAQEIEAVSMLGSPLLQPPITPSQEEQLLKELQEARQRYEQSPEDKDAIIWYGRRLAYFGRFNDALAIYTRGLQLHPQSVRIRRHSGHRLLTLRRLDDAVTELTRAAELAAGQTDAVEPDGQPNDHNIPRTTTQYNVWYHLGLAQYVRGEFADAAEAFEHALNVSRNDDSIVAATYWLVLIATRRGDTERADRLLDAITPQMDILENHGYHQLLLTFKGERDIEPLLREARTTGGIDLATIGYGASILHLINGELEEAEELWRGIIARTPWPAFGHLAAEAELARLQPAPR